MDEVTPTNPQGLVEHPLPENYCCTKLALINFVSLAVLLGAAIPMMALSADGSALMITGITLATVSGFMFVPLYGPSLFMQIIERCKTKKVD